MFTIISSIGKNYEIGNNNKLIWCFPEDLKFFKEKTMGKKLIMGHSTFESLPKVLPGREHIVISHIERENDNNVKYINDYNKLIMDYKKSEEELFIIGGEFIYRTFLPHCNKMYLTEIDAAARYVDSYFPRFNKDNFDVKVLDCNIEQDIEYKHVEYVKKKSLF